jgi:hypothetical protein
MKLALQRIFAVGIKHAFSKGNKSTDCRGDEDL